MRSAPKAETSGEKEHNTSVLKLQVCLLVRITKGSHEDRGVRLHTTSHSHTQRPEAPENYGVIIFYSFCSLGTPPVQCRLLGKEGGTSHCSGEAGSASTALCWQTEGVSGKTGAWLRLEVIRRKGGDSLILPAPQRLSYLQYSNRRSSFGFILVCLTTALLFSFTEAASLSKTSLQPKSLLLKSGTELDKIL